ncbi:MAG TPA: HD domain-containing protein [Candidatus Dormibacteraeota bacterium]|nr:HD domain-containing protein [Candidatus Dormibacteraeota bacterium]
MNRDLLTITNRIRDRALRARVREVLKNPSVKIDGRTYSGLPLEKSPASVWRHHNYPGGFVEHTLALYELSLSLARIVRRIYRCRVDTDLVICGVLLHDIFKPATYREIEGGRYRRSNLAERLDHLSLATAELIRRGFPLDVVHVVAASHGRQYGPIGPMTIEALICHLADRAEAELNGEMLSAARFMIREVTGEEPQVLTGKEAFHVVRKKTDEGWKGLRDSLSLSGRTVERTRP